MHSFFTTPELNPCFLILRNIPRVQRALDSNLALQEKVTQALTPVLCAVQPFTQEHPVIIKD